MFGARKISSGMLKPRDSVVKRAILSNPHIGYRVSWARIPATSMTSVRARELEIL